MQQMLYMPVIQYRMRGFTLPTINKLQNYLQHIAENLRIVILLIKIKFSLYFGIYISKQSEPADSCVVKQNPYLHFLQQLCAEIGIM